MSSAITKVSQNPLPANEGGYAKTLGNKHGHDLTGLSKLKLKKNGILIVYALVRTETSMKIIVISARANDEVYELASKRIESNIIRLIYHNGLSRLHFAARRFSPECGISAAIESLSISSI